MRGIIRTLAKVRPSPGQEARVSTREPMSTWSESGHAAGEHRHEADVRAKARIEVQRAGYAEETGQPLLQRLVRGRVSAHQGRSGGAHAPARGAALRMFNARRPYCVRWASSEITMMSSRSEYGSPGSTSLLNLWIIVKTYGLSVSKSCGRWSPEAARHLSFLLSTMPHPAKVL